MKLILNKHDLKTLEKNKDGWTYRISTIKGDIVGSCLPTEDEALRHAEKHLLTMIKKYLKK